MKEGLKGMVSSRAMHSGSKGVKSGKVSTMRAALATVKNWGNWCNYDEIKTEVRSGVGWGGVGGRRI
jgi:hypothetical protein